MASKIFTVTQTREVEVAAHTEHAAHQLANKAFYGNPPSKADPEGRVLSVIRIVETKTRGEISI